MKKYIALTILLFVTSICVSQEDIYPVYSGCNKTDPSTLESCFNQNLTKDVLAAFTVPETIKKEGYSGTINVIFLVNKEGNFEVLYVRSDYKELEAEAKRVFAQLPKAMPATFNGRPIEMRFGIPIALPLKSQVIPEIILKEEDVSQVNSEPISLALKPKKDIQQAVVKTSFPEHRSELNIPFTHQVYNDLSFYYDQNDNSHTASKPYLYSDASSYVDLDEQINSLIKPKESWIGRKFWNEHFFKVQENDFWFTINPVFDLQIGKDNTDNLDFTYNNTRAIQIQGGLGKNLNFHSSFYESQGRFPGYVREYIRDNTVLGASGIVPGRGKGKGLQEGGFDYPIAEAYLSYTPNKFFNFQFGHGKNFIGDGYRSMILSDVAAPTTHFKINTQFWKIKYTNLWMWIDDVRREVSVNEQSLRKFAAIHYLSWNVNKRLNIGLFEAVITNNENNNGFDINFFNPIIFYRAVEFTRGSEAGNALIGLTGKYKLTDNVTTYGQFVLDELTVGRFFDGDGYWANKFAVQMGAKYHNAFKIDNLTLQGEFNLARPYTFANRKSTLNYGHFNQPLGHLWGSNFWEAIGIARYKKDRWFGNAKLTFGKKGFDINGLNYGGDIYVSNDDRIADAGVELLQGNSTNIFIADLQAGYVINPTTNMQFFGGLTFRNFDPTIETTDISKKNTTWFTVGLRTDVFNWYFDF